MIVRDATQEDLDYLRLNAAENGLKDYPRLSIVGYAKTLLVDGVPLACGGVIVLWDKVGEGWLVVSKDVNERKVEIAYFLRNVIDETMKELKLKRLQVAVRTDFEKGKKFVEFLDFEFEGVMHSYFPDGSNAFLYARFI